LSILEGGPLKRNEEWQIFKGKLFTVLVMTSSNKKKITEASVRLEVIFTIKLLS
jgi:hypothetical protein